VEGEDGRGQEAAFFRARGPMARVRRGCRRHLDMRGRVEAVELGDDGDAEDGEEVWAASMPGRWAAPRRRRR